MTDPRKQTVRTGYDRLAATFLDWGARVEGDPRDRFVEEFAALLPVPGSVLDLGCGAGVPSTRRLAETFAVVGADISEVQIGLARRNVPGARFVCADVVDLEFAAPRSTASVPSTRSRTSRARSIPACSHACGGGCGPAACSWRRSASVTWPAGRASGSGSRCSSRATRRTRTCACWRMPALTSCTRRRSRCESPRARRRSCGSSAARAAGAPKGV